MYDLETYKKLFEFVENDEIMNDDINSIICEDYYIYANGDYEKGKIIFEHDEKTFNLAENWSSEIHRFDEDKPQFWYWQLDSSDEYALFVEGYYDSWGGSSIESGYMIGRVSEIVIKYIDFIKI